MFKKLVYILILSPVLMATTCEDNECSVIESPDNKTIDLIEFTPLQAEYNQGDALLLTINVPATNTYFEEEINLREATGDKVAKITLFSSNIFDDNKLNFIKGSQGREANWFNLPYNKKTERYELEVEITLNRTGLYFHYNGGEIDFGTSNCPDYTLKTNILGVDDIAVEFSVIK
ncbi:hypothetical protein [Marixanthomonas spongiae]|uniref:Uncharacterized protein n=1 Tax=Marixanthomonas spongiae TaxID=2174845 RepID=A0A2U0I1A6_9FLAO|nr:hypothetical protein [Marixanthomonas spongiae]PVW14780.1 hypothetical protein DDV96_09705 [Marixanthomonas spongiae]